MIENQSRQFLKVSEDLFMIDKYQFTNHPVSYEIRVLDHGTQWKVISHKDTLYGAYMTVCKYSGTDIFNHNAIGINTIYTRYIFFYRYEIECKSRRYIVRLNIPPYADCEVLVSSVATLDGILDHDFHHYANYDTMKLAFKRIAQLENMPELLRKDGLPYEKYIVSRY